MAHQSTRPWSTRPPAGGFVSKLLQAPRNPLHYHQSNSAARPWSPPMPEKATIERARRDAREGKSPSTQAGEFVREQIHHIRQGRHGARSSKQAIAIGLSEARRAGVKLPAPKKGRTSAATRKKAQQDTAKGQSGRRQAPSRKRSRARVNALKREPRSSASHRALSHQAKQAARRRSPAERSRSAHRGARTRRR